MEKRKTQASVRQSIFILILNLVILEVILGSLHVLIFRMFFNLLPGYGIKVNDVISIFVILIETFADMLLGIYVFTRWFGLRYEIGDGNLAILRGMVSTQKKVYSLKRVESITVYQGFLSKLLNFGKIEIFNPVWSEKVFMYWIPDPDHYAEILRENSGVQQEGVNTYKNPRSTAFSD